MDANWTFKSLGNIALILGALTAGGGITGYVRTGSVPSIAAGCTVGLLVCSHFISNTTSSASNEDNSIYSVDTVSTAEQPTVLNWLFSLLLFSLVAQFLEPSNLASRFPLD